MEEDSTKEEGFVQKGEKLKLGNIIKNIALFLAPIATVLVAIYGIWYTQQKDKEDKEIVKLNSQPHLEAQWGGEVPIGMEDYWRINLVNKNENNITSGTFNVQYRVLFQTEIGASEPFVWENVFMESEIAYDDDLQGCFLFIKADFFKYEDLVMEKCADNGIETLGCDSYVFCCFQYIEAGQEKIVYYLISLKPYEKCRVTEVENPEKYLEGYLMDS